MLVVGPLLCVEPSLLTVRGFCRHFRWSALPKKEALEDGKALNKDFKLTAKTSRTLHKHCELPPVQVKVTTVDGPVELKIPSGTQPGTTLLMAKRGVPRLGNSVSRGDHQVCMLESCHQGTQRVLHASVGLELLLSGWGQMRPQDSRFRETWYPGSWVKGSAVCISRHSMVNFWTLMTESAVYFFFNASSKQQLTVQCWSLSK